MGNNRNLDELCVNTIRMLAVDAVEKANSGHPGMPLGAAPMAYVLWTKFMRFNPTNTKWPNRDRFILSAGHGSALLYSLLHLTGYDVSLDEVKNFRQWESITPGHPESTLTPGVEVTTGPLGQGISMGVGMALAERYQAARFNKPDLKIVDHHIYSIVSDGDLMEGISSEAASIAGHQKLGKIVYLYDDNHISIEGSTDITFTEDVIRRFEAYGWHVQRVTDGNDLQAIEKAIALARGETERPSIIAVRTHIGYGSPKHDQASAHGEPLGQDAMKATRKFFGWPEDKQFYIPEEAGTHLRQAVERGQRFEADWREVWNAYRKRYPAEAEEFDREQRGELPKGWDSTMPKFDNGKGVATRAASGKVMNALAKTLPNFLGGSADLAPSNKTILEGFGDAQPGDPAGRNLHFGVREHGMGAIVNGIATYDGLIPYCSTFLVFSDYMRASIRIAALSHARSIFIFTHDSVGVGEDGPTHQPIEHLAALRAMPNLTVIRPADANETVDAWRLAIEKKDGPVVMVLSRQTLPTIDRSKLKSSGSLAQGAYVLADSEKAPALMIIASGSEIQIALAAKEALDFKGVATRVVSMPSWELFDEQPESYRKMVLAPDVKARLAVEAGSTMGWYRFVGEGGCVIGIDRFGASAPGPVAMEKFGISVQNVVDQALELIGFDEVTPTP